jgi:hypothetical protein
VLSHNASIAVIAVIVGVGGYALLRTETAPAVTAAWDAARQR